MRIDQLPVASAIGNTDTLPFSDGGITKQISVGNLTNSIRDDVYGAPLTASTSSAMTDTSRVYVYTGTTGGGFTNGHWYYYNGSAWTDGGTYNSAAVQTDPTLTLEGVPADAKATGELKTVIDDKLAEFDVAVETFYPTASGEGALVTIEGTVDAPPAEMVIYGKSVQDGTPAPDAPVDIVTAGSGGTIKMVSAGKNLVDYHAITPTGSSATVTEVENGVRITCTRGEFAGGSIVERCRVPGTYTLSFDAMVNLLAQGGNRIGFRHGDTNTFINAVTCETSGHYKVTATINVPFYLTFAVSRSTSAAGDVTFTNIMLVRESNEAEYVPYVGITSAIDTTPNGLPGIPVDSGGNYTDTNGQMWICDTIDLEAGVYTKRVETYTVTGSESISKSSESAVDTYLLYFPTGTPDLVKGNTAFLCSHFRASGTTAVGNAEIPTTGNYLRMRCHYAGAGTSTVEAFTAAITGMTVVYALAAPVVTQLTEAQIAALRALRGRKGLTNLYSADPVEPEFRADMYIDIPTYIQSVIKKPLSLYDLNITPGTWNNIHPDFDPETEEYAVTLRKGNAATVNAVVIGTTATVTFDTIGGARPYFTMRTSSSAVGDRKTYSCQVNPYDAGIGGGLVMTVTKGNLSRRYYLSITSVE